MTISSNHPPAGSTWEAIRGEKLLFPGILTSVAFLLFGGGWLGNLSNPWLAGFFFVWLFAAILISGFCVVRHADCIAIKLGEPLGTLVLTLSVIGMEVLMVSAVMLSGTPDPTMARDTMFGVIMIALNGLVGVALLAGGWRHHEQQYNLQGTVSFLTMLVPLAIAGLVLPYYTAANSSPALFKFRAVALIITMAGMYAAFLAVQTRRHPEHYLEPKKARLSDEAAEAMEHGHFVVRSLPFHVGLLMAYLLPVVILAKKLAIVLGFGAARLGVPQAFSGVIVAILILCPEGLAAVRAAWGNRIQRSVNILFGSALSTIALTVPAVLTISLMTGRHIELGLSPVNQIILCVTLAVSALNCVSGKTNVLNGLVHLVLFLSYLILMFEP